MLRAMANRPDFDLLLSGILGSLLVRAQGPQGPAGPAGAQGPAGPGSSLPSLLAQLAEETDPVFWDQQGWVFPVAGSGDTKAYFPSVLHDSSAPFSPDGVTFYEYVGSYASSGATTQTFCFSDDGITWVNPVKAVGIVPAGYHASIVVVGTNLRIWYWNPALVYSPAAMRTATCPLSSIPNFVGDVPCANGAPPWIVPGPAWNAGTYVNPCICYNPAPTDNPAVLTSWRYYGLVDVTSGGTEDLAAIKSSDGITWDLFAPAAVIPRTPGTWSSAYISAPTVWRRNGRYAMLYSGGIARAHEGIGLAYSDDLLN
jgi:hypothetical protein